ncbi:MAG: zinc-binding dehydrogenase [Halioglobus sp.]|nr:zinc-binding dehydrogenase [Halioglobus sp.]
MKAAVFQGPGQPLMIKDVATPAIADNEMLVKVRRCGICGTDIHASREGPFMAPVDTVFGHEFIGDVVEVGPSVPAGTFLPGDRVTSLPFIGEKTIGLGDITGAYSEYVKVGHELVLKVPDALDDNRGALIEPLAVGLHSVKMAEGIAEKDVLIIGAGPIGLACAIWSRFFGARSVVLSEMSPTRLDMARTLGFTQFVDPAGDVGAQFNALTQAAPGVQIECVGAPGILQACIERAPARGVIMGIGVCDNPDEIVPLTAFLKELRIQWAVGYDKDDFQFAIDMMVAGRVDASAMITDVVSLDQVPAAFEALRSPSGQCKVLIDLTR